MLWIMLACVLTIALMLLLNVRPRGLLLPPSQFHHQHVNGIQHAVYINLAHRKDRQEAVEELLRTAKVPFERFEAVNPRLLPELLDGCWDSSVCPGQVGCQLSHLAVLRRAMDAGWDHVAIFEDDFTWQPLVRPDMVQAAIAKAMELVPNWDVIALSLNIALEKPLGEELKVQFAPDTWTGLTRIENAQTTGGYIARRSVMAQIYDAFLPENCLVKKDYTTAIDQCWKPLQSKGMWVAFEPQPGTQHRSFSDIEQREVFYGLTRR